jgi:hypothetical protein
MLRDLQVLHGQRRQHNLKPDVNIRAEIVKK